MWLNRLQQTFRSFITDTQEESKFFSSANSSSSSSVILESKYDVFLSFRGEDTRHNFTAHLYEALCREKIATFIDDDGLKKGDEISPVLLKAIEDSKVSVIIFSKDYASSRWCLDELQKIVECRKSKGQIVVPVFYHIDPSDIRKQTGSYRNAFVNHHKRFKKTPERVQKWRAALTEAANLSGHHLTGNRSESKLVDEIVKDILKKLTDMSPLSDNCNDLVGIDRHIERITGLLTNSKIVGIWGMGGIGKTTIVEAFFKRIYRDFDSFCFINVQKQMEKYHNQLVLVQREIFSRILGEGNNVIEIPNAIPQLIKERLQRKSLLVVLDDVNNFKYLELLKRGLEPLHEESRIIVTTRDKKVLSYCGVNNIYEVEGLYYHEATLLFCKCAFKKHHAPENLEELSRKIIAHAKGNPLALEVLGTSLVDKSKEAWESVVLNLNVIDDPGIFDVLKISYDGLTEIEKNMFLDIACFFNWERKEVTKQILKACYERMEYCLEVLINKALIKNSGDQRGTMHMHDLLQEMGRKIVREECEDNPGKRSRLWEEDNICDVLQNNEGTDRVKAIVLNMSSLRQEIHLSSEAFVKMTNIRVLKLYWLDIYFQDYADTSKLRLPSVLEGLPKNLRYLQWDRYPWDELPSKFSAKKLVELKLPSSKIRKLWDEAKVAVNLKSIDVSYSHIIEFPNLQNFPMLETLLLKGCKRLSQFSSDNPCSTNLRFLDMSGCKCLTRFQRNIHFKSPVDLNFFSCINLTEFPKVSGKVQLLNLCWTAIEEIPASIKCLTELVKLQLRCCKKLKSISSNIFKLSSLYRLDLFECFKLESFLEINEEIERLDELHLDGTAIKELPSSIEHRFGLAVLGLYGTANKVLPKLHGSKLRKLWAEAKVAVNLKSIDVSNSHIIEFPNLQNVPKLESLLLKGCERLSEFSSGYSCSTNLRFLDMSGCKCLTRFQSNIHFKSPVNLHFSNCISLTEFPKVSGKVKLLNLGCTAIEEIPASIECLTELVTLYLRRCKQLKSISPNICKLSSLHWLDLFECFKLESFPEINEEMECLEDLHLDGTAIKELPSSIEHLVGLRELGLYGTAIKELPTSISKLLSLESIFLSGGEIESIPTSIKQLPRLKFFVIMNCNKLQSIPELPLSIEDLHVDSCKQLRSLPQLPSNLEQCDEKELFPPLPRTFNFQNCVNLIESISRERVEHMTTALGFFYKKERDEIPGFGFSLCGSEIPGWFRHQSPGSSITIERPQKYCGNRKFIGFALSAVITAEKDHCGTYDCEICDEYWVRCYYDWGTFDDCIYVGCFYGLIESDHIALSFYPAKYMTELLEGGCTTVTFDFSISVKGFLKLKSCGLCPIYEEPNMPSPAEDNRSSNEEVETMSDEDHRSKDKEVETMSHDSSIMGGLSLPHVGLFQPKKCTYGSPAEGSQGDNCGVHPVNAEPNISQPTASSEPFAAGSEDLDPQVEENSSKRKFHELITSGSEIGNSNEQEVEPHPKRICKNQINSLTEKFLSPIKSGLSSLFRRT